MSLSSYTMTLGFDHPPFIAIPVFASRVYRHQSIFINTKAGIKSPEDLKGKRVGIPEYQMTASVWERGIMKSEYGVPYDSMTYYTGASEPSAGKREEKIKLNLPDGIKVHTIEEGKNLSQMLQDGEIDALFTAHKPSSFMEHPDKVQRLFPNFKDVEKKYFKKTKIFPIMHVIVLRRDTYERYPWIAKSMQLAFAKSLDIAYEAISNTGSLRYMLPWLQDHLEETQDHMGERYWEDGCAENRHVLDQFLEYHYEQGLSKKRLSPEDLFAPNCLDNYVV